MCAFCTRIISIIDNNMRSSSLPNLSGLASRERSDPLKANMRFHKLQMAAFKTYGRPLESFAEFRARFYPDDLQRADQVTGWSQLDLHEMRWADFLKRRLPTQSFRDFVAREY